MSDFEQLTPEEIRDSEDTGLTAGAVFAPPTYVFRLDDSYEYVDQNGQTACNWKKYTLAPGVYLVKFTTIDGRPVLAGDHPYYADIVVQAVLTETYDVSRIFQYSSAEHRTGLNVATTRTLSLYAYQVAAGYRLCGGVIEVQS